MRVTLLGIVFATLLSAAPAELRKAESLYQQTRYKDALQAVEPLLGQYADAFLLAGRAAFGLGDYRKATEFLEKAVQSDPRNSTYYHWLGRTFGMRAETSLPITAPHYASKARQNFEKAVQLDPSNGEALNDLFEFYLQAPGFLGGGLDKAQALLSKIKAVDPAEEQYALAKLQEARKDFGSAEQHLRRAAELAPRSVGRVLDVARFLARQGRFSESVTWLGRAETISPKDPQVMFKTAQTYVEAKKNLPAAKALLEAYLRAPLNPDLPTRAEAEKLLKRASGGL
ncbi:MAG: tetratricopeptide repeat protein [Acidobacteria bacterium]|nr:tetratricopeptide repeat protein [Acidobacteriota bacterium]